MYLSGKVDESTFCDEFYYSYDIELDYDTLNTNEEQAFFELSEIVSRFSDSKEDHQKYPGIYYTQEDLRQQILETKKRLKNYFEKLQINDELNESYSENQSKLVEDLPPSTSLEKIKVNISELISIFDEVSLESEIKQGVYSLKSTRPDGFVVILSFSMHGLNADIIIYDCDHIKTSSLTLKNCSEIEVLDKKNKYIKITYCKENKQCFLSLINYPVLEYEGEWATCHKKKKRDDLEGN